MLAILCLAASSGAVAAAKGPPPPPDPEDYADSGFGWELTLHTLLNFSYHEPGGGVGFQLAWPVVPNGFIPREDFRDALLLEGGLDYTYLPVARPGADWGYHFLSFLAGARYTVYVHDVLAPFVAVKIGYGAGLWEGDGGQASTRHVFDWATTLGLLWDFAEWASLRVELGYGQLHEVIRLGVDFRF